MRVKERSANELLMWLLLAFLVHKAYMNFVIRAAVCGSQ